MALLRRYAALTLASTLLAATAAHPQTGGTVPGPVNAPVPRDMARACANLTGRSAGDVAITSAVLRQAGPPAEAPGTAAPLPPHCYVEGTINRRVGVGGADYGIGFALALALDWNGRFLLQGGGGLNGVVLPPTGPVAAGHGSALAMGFAVASHDSGHKGAVFDASFQADQRAALDFAETAVLTVTQATRAIATAFYGRAPHHSYMTGCSTGGREGMLASQRYPELFDGIVIGAPAMRPGRSNLAVEQAQVMLNALLPPGAAGPAGFDRTERNAITTQLARQCDAADGRADGIIANVEACRRFDTSALVCTGQQTDDHAPCMTGERAAVLGRIFAGQSYYVPIPWDTGITYQGPGLPGYLPAGQPGPFGPASAARTIDIAARLQAIDQDAVGRLTDTPYWTNLSTFLGRGSKIMFFHGVSDPWFSAFDTWDYFQRARQSNGAEAWDNAARFYMVPGMLHCGGGNTFDRFDLLGPLVDWVERGAAPSAISAARSDGQPGAMPLCPHPAYAHYLGGDPLLAASYACRMPAATTASARTGRAGPGATNQEHDPA